VIDRRTLALKFRVAAHAGPVKHLTIVSGCLYSLGKGLNGGYSQEADSIFCFELLFLFFILSFYDARFLIR
jgi:hypothetical protein